MKVGIDQREWKKKECSGIACLGRELLYRVKKKCVGGCAWQKRCNEKVMVKFDYNVDKYIQTH
jgi:hypothetical protein